MQYRFDSSTRTCLDTWTELARACMQQDPSSRPTFKEVLPRIQAMKADAALHPAAYRYMKVTLDDSS